MYTLHCEPPSPHVCPALQIAFLDAIGYVHYPFHHLPLEEHAFERLACNATLSSIRVDDQHCLLHWMKQFKGVSGTPHRLMFVSQLQAALRHDSALLPA